ncbi:MAG: GMC family oxidoreductase [Woeseiaceae bacterium]|nr:GMC family oxidoreductase [Woeseiaceae bacterium]
MTSSDPRAVLEATEPYDVCIVGSGPAGTILGTTLAKQGVRTLILESGRGLATWLTNSRVQSLARYDFTGDTDYPLKRTTSRLLGGNSNFWTGRCERFHPSDFETHPYTPADNPWPIRYADLEPYYDTAEQLLRVRGGKRNEYSPPRSGPLPLPPNPDISVLRSLCDRLGVDIEESATATPTKTFRMFNVHKEILPAFHDSGNGHVLTGLTVTRLLADADRKVNGAEVKSLDGETYVARARYFVVCCGGLESPRMLLLSASETFPNGIGNAHDMVGRGFNDHPNVGFMAQVPHSWGTLAPTNKVARTHQFYETFREEGLGAIVPVFRQAWVLPNHLLPFRLRNIPYNTASMISRLAKAAIYFGAGTEMTISKENRVTLSQTRKDSFGNPVGHLIFNYSDEDRLLLERARTLILGWLDKLGATRIHESPVAFSRHHQGACRMGQDPRSSVVDRDLRVHETPNLYVCGSEVFSTGGGMTPTVTISALALRLADHLGVRLRSG